MQLSVLEAQTTVNSKFKMSLFHGICSTTLKLPSDLIAVKRQQLFSITFYIFMKLYSLFCYVKFDQLAIGRVAKILRTSSMTILPLTDFTSLNLLSSVIAVIKSK